jgi:hypothetical protein
MFVALSGAAGFKENFNLVGGHGAYRELAPPILTGSGSIENVPVISSVFDTARLTREEAPRCPTSMRKYCQRNSRRGRFITKKHGECVGVATCVRTACIDLWLRRARRRTLCRGMEPARGTYSANDVRHQNRKKIRPKDREALSRRRSCGQPVSAALA